MHPTRQFLRWLAVLPLVIFLAPQASAATRKSEAKPASKVVQRVSLKNGYEAIIYQGGEGLVTGRLEIRRHGKAVHRQEGFGQPAFFFPALTKNEPLIERIDQDITGDGVPDLVVRMELLGTTMDHVFSLSTRGLIEHGFIAHGYGGAYRQYFFQADKDPALEVRDEEGAFVYHFGLSRANSPQPKILRKFKINDGASLVGEPDGQGAWEFANTRKPLPKAEWERLQKQAAALSKTRGGPMESPHVAQFVGKVADLIYTGNADKAREYVRLAFRGHDDKRVGFLAEFAAILSLCDDAIPKLNGCQSVAEVIAGPAGRFPGPGERPMIAKQ